MTLLHDIVIGRSVRMRALFDFLEVISHSDSTMLLTGESGTGKEVTARIVHDASRRRARPFVPVSCALFSETLIESELFGHERGAFTGAVKDRPGRFELADGGTLFLDDIDDVPLSIQVKLLRALQNRTVERLGGTRPMPINVRVIAGTKRDLRQLVAEGRFREDLFYRLNVLPVTLPPLRDRREDIPDLVDHFMRKAAARAGTTAPPVPDFILDLLVRHDWPGNVRELENTCERIVQTCVCGTVGTGCLTFDLFPTAETLPIPSVPGPMGPEMPGGSSFSLDDRLKAFETSLIAWALRESGGNKSKAAALLAVKRSTLGDRIARCGLSWILAVLLLGGASTVAAQVTRGVQSTQQAPPVPLTIASLAGKDTFDAYCAPCHGRDGSGNGPVAAALKAPAVDLRRLEMKRGGVFPRAELISFVAGKGRVVAAHGTADMPVWGPTFRALDPNDVRVNVRIENVVDYLRDLQLK